VKIPGRAGGEKNSRNGGGKLYPAVVAGGRGQEAVAACARGDFWPAGYEIVGLGERAGRETFGRGGLPPRAALRGPGLLLDAGGHGTWGSPRMPRGGGAR